MKSALKILPLLLVMLAASTARAVDPTSVSGLVTWVSEGTGMYTDTGRTTPVANDGDGIGGLQDLSGNGNHLTQGTAANQWKWDKTNHFMVSEYGNKTEYFNFPTVSAITNTNSTVVFIGQLTTLRDINSTAGNVTSEYVFCGTSFNLACGRIRGGQNQTSDGTTNRNDSSAILATSPICWIFSSSGTNTTVYVNGQTSTIAAMATKTFTTGVVGGLTGGTNPLQARFKDFCIYNRAINSTEAATILSYAQTRGVNPTVTGNVVIDGDSITAGYGSTLNRNWVNDTSVSSGTRVSNFAEAGITLATLSTEAATKVDPWIQAGKTNVLIVFAGTNDINGSSGAAVYSALQSYCSARKTAGWNKIIVGTMLPRGIAESERQIYNADIRAGFANQTLACDAVADCGSDATIGQASSNTNLTYYLADGVHPTNAGYAIIAPYFQNALYSVMPSSNPVQPRGNNHIGIDLGIGLSSAANSDVLHKVLNPAVRWWDGSDVLGRLRVPRKLLLEESQR